jgi:hypothetical protein
VVSTKASRSGWIIEREKERAQPCRQALKPLRIHGFATLHAIVGIGVKNLFRKSAKELLTLKILQALS